jgi:Flp pilus assembly protein TadG
MRAVVLCTNRLRRFSLRDERGTQFVELAIVLPVMLLMLASVAEFGRFFYTYSTLSKATRAGARYLISQPAGTKSSEGKNLVVFGTTSGDGTAAVERLSALNVEVSYDSAAKTTTVSIKDYTYEPIFDLGKLTKSPELSLSVPVKASTTMRQLVD